MVQQVVDFEDKTVRGLRYQIEEYLKNKSAKIVAQSHEGHEIDGGRNEKYTALVTFEITK